ncbi:hypothetical protein NG726_24680 [Pseudomonas sp. MOB-449]|nr:hypothetical protein [Pseudomonas sp. MOB-449]
MANIQQSLESALNLDGAMAAAVVGSGSGMLLGHVGSGVDLELAAAGNTEVVRAKLKTMKALALSDVIEDILILFSRRGHVQLRSRGKGMAPGRNALRSPSPVRLG